MIRQRNVNLQQKARLVPGRVRYRDLVRHLSKYDGRASYASLLGVSRSLRTVPPGPYESMNVIRTMWLSATVGCRTACTLPCCTIVEVRRHPSMRPFVFPIRRSSWPMQCGAEPPSWTWVLPSPKASVCCVQNFDSSTA